VYAVSESVSELEECSLEGKRMGETAVFFGDEGRASGSVVGESGVGDSGVKELGALGDKGGVPFTCCNDEEATGGQVSWVDISPNPSMEGRGQDGGGGTTRVLVEMRMLVVVIDAQRRLTWQSEGWGGGDLNAQRQMMWQNGGEVAWRQRRG